VRTFNGWDDPPPGFMEPNPVAHNEPTVKGSFVQTLTLTDIATEWTECATLLVREQTLLTEATRLRLKYRTNCGNCCRSRCSATTPPTTAYV